MQPPSGLERFGIQPGEGPLLFWGTLCLALLGWADVSLANVAETFFLKRVGVEYLPRAFLASSLLLVLSTYAMGRFVERVDRARLLTRVLFAMSALLLVLYAVVAAGVGGAFSLLLLVSKQVKVIALLLFFVAIGDWLTGRQAKRLFGPLMAGLTIGTVGGSFASAPIGEVLGLEGVLYFAAGIVALAGFAATQLQRARPSRLEQGLQTREASSLPRSEGSADSGSGAASYGIRELWRESGLFRLLLGTALASGILGPMLYFQFSFVADLSTQGPGGEQQLLDLYSKLRGWIYLGILVTQLGVSSRLYRRIGIPLSVGLFPLIYLLGFIGLSTQLSLRAGVAAVSMARLQGKAVYEPALRVLFNLMPEPMRPRATALLEGPTDRVGGALGNLTVMGALAWGSPIWVGYLAIPITLGWIAISVLLWRRYPNLLLSAAAQRRSLGDARESEELLDPATLRGLATPIEGPDRERCQSAVDLVCEAEPDRALEILARALERMPSENRDIGVAAIDHLLEARIDKLRPLASVARTIERVLADPQDLDESSHADLVQAWGRLAEAGANTKTLDSAGRAGSAAVRLAALAALHQRGAVPRPQLDAALAGAIAGTDRAARRTAREEIRARLLVDEIDADWRRGLGLLAQRLEAPEDRAATANALADVAAARGKPAAAAAAEMCAWRDTRDPALLESLLRFVGHCGLVELAPWLADHLASVRQEVAAAAREGLVALGPGVTDALLVEHAYGRRSAREAILEIVGEFEVDHKTLHALYDRELDWIRHSILRLHTLQRPGSADRPELSGLVLDRIDERIDEGLHALLLYLTAIRREGRIAQLDGLLRRARGTRRHAILLEALEGLLSANQRKELMPLLEDHSREIRARSVASELGRAQPSFLEASTALLGDLDELTRTLATATWPEGLDASGDLARQAYIADHPGVLTPVDIALQLREIPLFERLSTRQLMDVVPLVREESHSPGAELCRIGEEGSCMYLIADGEVQVSTDDATLATMGAGGFFGEMALFNGVERSATVTATRELRLLRLERDDLLTLMDEIPGIAIAICQALSSRLRDANLR